MQITSRMDFVVRNSRSDFKLIPYIGCKAGFSSVFDELIPDYLGGHIYDVFGGSGAFALYACNRFGSESVTYNDNNPVMVNLIRSLRKDPEGLWRGYQAHYEVATPEHYYSVRSENQINSGVEGAANFMYLAKNAFSGKIRFNSSNAFNSPIRKGSKCPKVELSHLQRLSKLIANLTITCEDYRSFSTVRDSFLYLDPPYFQNDNGHYNGVLDLREFKQFLRTTENTNMVMLSEQNDPALFDLSDDYSIDRVLLSRSLQYKTQRESREIIATNY